MSRALSHDGILKEIMEITDQHGKLESAVWLRRFVIYTNFGISTREAKRSTDDYASDNSMALSDNSDGENVSSEFDIWGFIIDILDDECVGGHLLTQRGIQLIVFYMCNAYAWRRDSIY